MSNQATIDDIISQVSAMLSEIARDEWAGRITAKPTVWVTVYWRVEDGSEIIVGHKTAVGSNIAPYRATSQTFRVLTELESNKSALARLKSDLVSQFVNA